MIVASYFWTISLFLLLFKDIPCESRRGVSKSKNGRIMGGYAVAIQKIPYQAYLVLKQSNDYIHCGGSIISKRFILTAGHCLTGVSKVSVRVGSSIAESGGSTFISTNFTRHPKYDEETKDYDVAVIHLPRDIKLNGNTKKPVKLPKSGACVKPRTELLISGWGSESENGSATTHLRAVELYVVNMKKCAEAHETITSHMFCAGVPQGGKDSCQGDSGGPAVSMNNIQLGIVSFGTGCGRKGVPGVYTNVATVREWIQSITGV